jgi:hypothetical protein
LQSTVAGTTGKVYNGTGGTYTIGKLNHQLNPLRKVTVDSFYIAVPKQPINNLMHL